MSLHCFCRQKMHFKLNCTSQDRPVLHQVQIIPNLSGLKQQYLVFRFGIAFGFSDTYQHCSHDWVPGHLPPSVVIKDWNMTFLEKIISSTNKAPEVCAQWGKNIKTVITNISLGDNKFQQHLILSSTPFWSFSKINQLKTFPLATQAALYMSGYWESISRVANSLMDPGARLAWCQKLTLPLLTSWFVKWNSFYTSLS